MNVEEYKQWRQDAYATLTATQYTPEQAETILVWMDTIKGADERDLLGDERNHARLAYQEMDLKHFSLYNVLMSKMWMYASLILDRAESTN
jgi:hypothetical protein